MTKMTPQPALGGLLLLLVAALLLGTVGVAAAEWNRLQPTPPLTLTWLRLGLAAPCLLALAGATTRRNPFRLAPRDWPRLVLMGGVMAVCHSLFFLAIPLAGVTLVVVISLCSAPVIVALLSIPLFRERMNCRVGVALGLGLIGTAVLVLGGRPGTGLAVAPGYVMGALLASAPAARMRRLSSSTICWCAPTRSPAARQWPGRSHSRRCCSSRSPPSPDAATRSRTHRLAAGSVHRAGAHGAGLLPHPAGPANHLGDLGGNHHPVGVRGRRGPGLAAAGEAIGVLTGVGALLLAASVALLARPGGPA